MDELGHSPVITEPIIQSIKMFDFFDALREVFNGEKITRASWDPEICYGFLKDGILTIFIKGAFRQWVVSEGDMDGTDWVVIPNE